MTGFGRAHTNICETEIRSVIRAGRSHRLRVGCGNCRKRLKRSVHVEQVRSLTVRSWPRASHWWHLRHRTMQRDGTNFAVRISAPPPERFRLLTNTLRARSFLRNPSVLGVEMANDRQTIGAGHVEPIGRPLEDVRKNYFAASMVAAEWQKSDSPAKPFRRAADSNNSRSSEVMRTLTC